MKDLLLDIRYALRALWKSRAFALMVGLTLTLAIGANVFVFGIVNAVLLHSLDQANPRDPVVVVSAVLTLILLGVASSAVPAMRALAVDPSKLMRDE